MFFSLLVALYTLSCFILILLVLLQKGKGSMGLGNLGGGAQLLFGGSGGQDLFQKVTWVLGAIFMIGSLGLSLMKGSQYRSSRILDKAQAVVWNMPS